MDQEHWPLLDVVPDAVILTREDGAIVFANTQAEDLFGYARDEFTGLRLEVLMPERFRERHKEYRAAYCAQPVVRPMGSHFDLVALSKDGRELPVDITLSPIETANGLFLAASIRDITHLKSIERQLRDNLAEVERLKNRLKMENLYLRDEIKGSYDHQEIIGASDALKLMLHKIDQVAMTDATVLILGETGTGKELIARAIHSRSSRNDRPLVKVDCGALPTSLIESELFGHEKGAFTGAVTQEIGRFELAGGGTIFLDEIGELERRLQKKLLRVLQEGNFERIGSATPRHVDVRVIAATNLDLRRAMQEERFRPDLYFRLAVFPIEVPPLRMRREDVPLLVRHFVSKHQAKLRRKIEEIPEAVIERLKTYDWPGNVRELENVVERAMILSPSSTLVVEELYENVARPSVITGKSASMEAVERAYLLKVLEECNWLIKGERGAARRLGLKPSTLHSRMKRLGIQRP